MPLKLIDLSQSAGPMFVNPAKLNFRLMPASPCIDVGDPALGVYRGRAPDVGLHETGDGPIQGTPANLPAPAS